MHNVHANNLPLTGSGSWQVRTQNASNDLSIIMKIVCVVCVCVCAHKCIISVSVVSVMSHPTIKAVSEQQQPAIICWTPRCNGSLLDS